MDEIFLTEEDILTLTFWQEIESYASEPVAKGEETNEPCNNEVDPDHELKDFMDDFTHSELDLPEDPQPEAFPLSSPVLDESFFFEETNDTTLNGDFTESQQQTMDSQFKAIMEISTYTLDPRLLDSNVFYLEVREVNQIIRSLPLPKETQKRIQQIISKMRRKLKNSQSAKNRRQLRRTLMAAFGLN